VSTTDLGRGLLTRLLDDLVANVEQAQGAGISIVSGDGFRHVAGVGCALEWDPAQVEVRQGPLVEAVEGDVVRVEDPLDLGRYAHLARTLGQQDAAAAAAVVLPAAWVGDARLVTTLYVAESVTRATLDTLGRYEPLLAHSLALLEYCGEAEVRAAQMLEMTQLRRVIEQAKGVVMTTASVDADDAFAVLAEASQAANVKLRELAVALVELVGGGPAEQPADPAAVLVPDLAATAAARGLWTSLRAPTARGTT
jgi:hypothetical protein